MGASSEGDGNTVSSELLDQMQGHARVLCTYDESQDLALDLHEAPFSPSTRQKVLEFLDSQRYRDAVSSLSPATEAV